MPLASCNAKRDELARHLVDCSLVAEPNLLASSTEYVGNGNLVHGSVIILAPRNVGYEPQARESVDTLSRREDRTIIYVRSSEDKSVA